MNKGNTENNVSSIGIFGIIQVEQKFSLCRKCLPALTAGGLSALFEEHVDVR